MPPVKLDCHRIPETKRFSKQTKFPPSLSTSCIQTSMCPRLCHYLLCPLVVTTAPPLLAVLPRWLCATGLLCFATATTTLKYYHTIFTFKAYHSCAKRFVMTRSVPLHCRNGSDCRSVIRIACPPIRTTCHAPYPAPKPHRV